ncbi:MAG: hypothetical protein SNJ75_09435 [Gemmataceae bacterium]
MLIAIGFHAETAQSARFAVAVAATAALLWQSVRCAAAVGLEQSLAAGQARGFNHSPPPPIHAMLCFAVARLILGSAPAVAAGEASERTKPLSGRRRTRPGCSALPPALLTAQANYPSERTKGVGPNIVRSPGCRPGDRAAEVPRKKGNRKGEESQARQESRQTFLQSNIEDRYFATRFDLPR